MSKPDDFEEQALVAAKAYAISRARYLDNYSRGVMSSQSFKAAIARAETKFVDTIYDLRQKFHGKPEPIAVPGVPHKAD